MSAVLIRAAEKAAPRRFTGAPLTGFGDLDCYRSAAPTLGQAHAALKAEFLHALATDPTTDIATPAFHDALFGPAQMAMEAVLEDQLGGAGTEADWSTLMRIVGRLAKADPELAAWCDAQAEKHAAFHANDSMGAA